MLHVSVIVLAYLMGSIPFGYLLVKLWAGGDVRETGSGGTGATNVTRRLGRRAGLLTLALDAVKGALAVVVARWLLTDGAVVDWWVIAAALAAVAGHIFPVWLSFHGGKGVATGLGVFLSLSPLAVLCALPVFLVVVWATRYVSLGSIIAAALLPLFIWLIDRSGPSDGSLAPLMTAAVIGGALIVLMHRANIGRLVRGTESKLK